MYLSKSDFLKYQLCSSFLWLWKYKKEVVPLDEAEDIERRLEQGNEIEAFARKLFSNGVLVEGSGELAERQTLEYVRSGVKTIFQATVYSDNGLLAMADVIEFDEVSQSWTLYEVKSTNSVKPEHIMDVAFQKAAFAGSGYKIGKTGVIFLNKEYVRQSVVDPTKLLVKEDISARVDEVLPEIIQQMYDALAVVNSTQEPETCSCRLNTKSKHCPTFSYLNKDIPEYSVFNLSRIRGKKLENLVDNEILSVTDVPSDMKLSAVQTNQVAVAKSGRPIVDKGKIDKMFQELEYPLYFLDYETVSTAIPLFAGCKPFQQIPFQYSLHVLESADSKLKHAEYLSRNEAKLPINELLKSMSDNIGETGSVIVWYKSFEMSRNNEMAAMLPEFEPFLTSVNERVFDLMDIFSKQHYVHPDFKGSSSIKAVLPVLVPELSYKDMDIQNGAVASVRWYDAIVGSVGSEDAEGIFNSLIEYCKLDTLAMVRIYEHLKTMTS